MVEASQPSSPSDSVLDQPRQQAQTGSDLATLNDLMNWMKASLEKQNVIEEEHSHWEQTSKLLQCDPFLHHVNNYMNWFNYSHQIVRHQSRPCMKPQVLSTITSAYGNLMAPKVAKCLKDQNLHVRQKALLWTVELLATPDGRFQCLKAGILEVLTKLFDEEDMFIKQQVALAARHLAGMQEACVKMSHFGFIKWLLKMVSSVDEVLRELSLNALYYASFNETVRTELVSEELTMSFILKTSKEMMCDKCLTLGIKILQRCLAGGTDKTAISKLLSFDAIPTLTVLIKSPDSGVKEASIHLLGLICMHKDAKSQAEKIVGIDTLVPLLKDENIELQTVATSALMSMTIDINAKKDFIKADGIHPLIPLVDKSSKILSFNSLQLATNVAEDPEGRSQLQKVVGKVQNILNTSESQIQKRFAKAALQQLKFKHRPFT